MLIQSESVSAVITAEPVLIKRPPSSLCQIGAGNDSRSIFESMTFSRIGPFATNVGAKRLDSCSHWLGLPTSASAKAQSSRSVGILRVKSKRRRLAVGGGRTGKQAGGAETSAEIG